MTFTHLLHDLIALVGRRVCVTASAPDGFPALACSGTILHGVEVLDEEPDGEHEVFYFPVSADASHGFMIARQAFEGAEWHEGVLHIGLGPVELQIEPTD